MKKGICVAALLASSIAHADTCANHEQEQYHNSNALTRTQRWSCSSFYAKPGSIRSPRTFTQNPPQSCIPDNTGLTLGFNPNGKVEEPTAQISISGHVTLSAFYDCNKDSLNDFFAPVLLPVGDNNPHFRAYARESRFRIKSEINTCLGKIATLIESDFFSDSMASEILTSSENFRIRIATGEWFFAPCWSLRLGQDYSTFCNFFAFPRTVEFNGPVGSAQIRQPLARLTYQQDNLNVSVGIENPESTIFTTIGGPITRHQICSESGNNPCGVNDEVPDFTIRIEGSTFEDHAKFQLSGVLSKHIAGTSKAGGGVNGYTVGDRATGYGLLAATRIQVTPYLALTAMGLGGKGIGRYLYDIGYGQAAIFHSDTGTLSLINAWGANGSVVIDFCKTIQANIVTGISKARRSDLIVDANEKDIITHINLFWQPVKQLQFGIEWIRGKVYRVGQHPITGYRYQTNATFYF